MRGVAQMPTPALPADVTIEDRVVPARDGHPEVPVRIYRPSAVPTSVPAFYYVHGGGMVAGTVAMSDLCCAEIASQLNVLVASVDYGLAPASVPGTARGLLRGSAVGVAER